jgi:hypothetical protein
MDGLVHECSTNQLKMVKRSLEFDDPFLSKLPTHPIYLAVCEELSYRESLDYAEFPEWLAA